MDEWRGIQDTPEHLRGAHIAVGVFDGVHRGHQHLIARCVEGARAAERPSVVMTFDPNPMEIIAPGTHLSELTSLVYKAELFAQLGVDGVCVVPFTRALSNLSPREFVERVVLQMGASRLYVGENFRFGAKAAGDTEILKQLSAEYGASAETVPLISGTSSTRVRRAIAEGKMHHAAQMLGRPHRIEGVVVRGDLRGRTLGFPTANLSVSPRTAIPADGVYACWVTRASKRYPAAVSVGTNLTFAGDQHRVEAYILDFSDDVYGERLEVDFLEHIRDMERFDDVSGLIDAIERDVRQTRQITSSTPDTL